MLRFAPPITLRLEPGRLLSWRRQTGVRLRVLAGSAWVTQSHDMEDHFLQPGQVLALQAGSRALIGAEHGEVSLRFETDGGFGITALWQRLRAARARRAAALPACLGAA